ncbi:MAG: tetratricopeptide repeat protein [Limisphaerales bacterium]
MKTLFTIIISLGLVSVGMSDTTNAPAGSSQSQSAGLVQKEYDAGIFVDKLKTKLTPQAGESDYSLVLRYLKQNGVEVQKPEAIFLNERKHQLYVRASKSEQEKIEALIVKLQPVSTTTLIEDAKLTFEMGKLDEAAQKFQKVLEIEPDNATAHYYLEQIHNAQKTGH